MLPQMSTDVQKSTEASLKCPQNENLALIQRVYTPLFVHTHSYTQSDDGKSLTGVQRSRG